MDQAQAQRVNRALNKLSKLYREAKARKLGSLGLHPGQDVLLWLLAKEPTGMTVSELAARLGIEQPTATRTLARLEPGGWFRREPVEHDRRQVRIVVTEAARALVPEIERAWAELAEEAFGTVGEERRELVLDAIEHANDRFRAEVGTEVLADD